MTTEELIAIARHHRLQRPETTLERMEEHLRAMLDMLVLDFDCERETISTPALVARRLATIVADLEDRDRPLLHQTPASAFAASSHSRSRGRRVPVLLVDVYDDAGPASGLWAYR